MLPSQIGSAPAGNGSASGRGIVGHGGGSGVRPVLVRAGHVGYDGDRDAVVGMLGGARGARPPPPGNGTGGVTQLQSANAVGLTAAGGGGGGGGGVVLAQGAAGRFDHDRGDPLCSGSDNDSDSVDDEDSVVGSLGDSRRGVKRERDMVEAAVAGGQEVGVPAGAYGMVSAGGVAGAKPGKKTRGRVKIKMEFIDNKLRRYTTFSKRKTGIMKKAYELSTLTGTQVLLLVASETGHVYTFATRKLQPMITSETGKALIQTCLNSPDSPPRSDPSTDQRMSATGFEETDLTYQVSEAEGMGETKDTLKPTFTVANLPGSVSSTQSTVPTTSTTMQVSSGYPITNYLAPVSANSNVSANGTVLKAAGPSASVMQLPGGFTFMPAGTPLPPGTPTIPLSQLQSHSLALQGQHGVAPASAQGQQAVFRFPTAVSLTGVSQQLQAIQVHPNAQGNSDSSPEISHSSSNSTYQFKLEWCENNDDFAKRQATVSLPATIVTSSVPTTVAGHMMYPSPHTVMYASSPALDGSLAVLNAFSQGTQAMQVSHQQAQDTGGVPQVFLTAPPGTVQIPVSAVQLHPMVIGQQAGGSSTNLTELQVVNLEAAQNSKGD
ncbi:serum response factor b isoform X2 [Eucyclogobius newberryi]|uniref:serum response factor b isoform X2 n=1 Tax=Eucyclogobius newberryi TaxID=166745 RepID=UPI003B5A21D2